MRSFVMFCAELLKNGRTSYASIIISGKDWELVKYKDYYILAIYGTKGWKEWLNNFSRNGWISSADRIQSEYLVLYPYYLPDYVVGYSRGGAIALHVSLNWGIPAITFSAPNVSEDAFLMELKNAPIMFENRWDLVTKIPSWRFDPTPAVKVVLPGWKHEVMDLSKLSERKWSLLKRLFKDLYD